MTPGPKPAVGAGALVARMELVARYRDALLRLQGAWDMLALLGPMSGIGTEIGQTRDAFHRLTDTLVTSLARQLLQQRLQGLRDKAQVTIDILVRNLFERTADVGFLATDAPLRDFVQAVGDGTPSIAQRQAMQARFVAYVAKYSVYDDIVVVAADGRVLVRLDDAVTTGRSDDPLIAAALQAGVPYVERFGPTDLLGGRRGLIYAAAIADAGGRLVAVLCLSFRFEDEMRGVFSHLLAEADDGTVLALRDASGVVLVSSDAWQLPGGAWLPQAAAAGSLLRFAGRESLGVGACSAGYQGYPGPAWQALASIPVDFAFRGDDAAPVVQAGGSDDDLAASASGIDTRDIFDAELQAIPMQAQQIQHELTRSVWNGKLAQRQPPGAPALRRSAAEDGARPGAAPSGPGAVGTSASASFTATFLHEVSRTGTQIRGVFDDAISRLQTGAIVTLLEQARFQARLAIDIMDRNLYERANDCRWWALTPVLREALAEPNTASLERAGQVLQHINGLYTVYTLLVLFDAEGRIVAVSDPDRRDLLGTLADPVTVQATLALRDPERYHVSPFKPSALYGDVPTFVYAAGVQAPGGAVLGGVAIVFDSAPQFAAMLLDALPRGTSGEPLAGAVGLFVARDGSVLACTEPRFAVGSRAPFALPLLDLPHGAAHRSIVEIDGVRYAAGIGQGGGYREYRQGNGGPGEAVSSPHDVAGVVLLRLGQTVAPRSAAPVAFEPVPRGAAPAGGTTAAGSTTGQCREIAGFALGAQWFGLASDEIDEVLAAAPLLALPNAPSHLVGLLRHRGEVLPVIDLGVLLGLGPAPADGPLLVCLTDHGQRIALRVEALGVVFSVDAAQLRPWQPAGGGRTLHLISGRSAGEVSMLTLLCVDALWSPRGADVVLSGLAVARDAPPPLQSERSERSAVGLAEAMR